MRKHAEKSGLTFDGKNGDGDSDENDDDDDEIMRNETIHDAIYGSRINDVEVDVD